MTLLPGTRSVSAALTRAVSSRRRRGTVVVAVVGLLVLGLVFKSSIALELRRGETVQALFSENVALIPGETRVKMAGLQVGLVADVQSQSDGSTRVSLRLDEGVTQKLGSAPSARVQPLTILGGAYAVELVPGPAGEYDGQTIPLARTRTPVELDRILEALPSPTRVATRRTVRNLSETLAPPTQRSLRDLARASRDVMAPGGRLWVSARGTRPSTDLPTIVGDLRTAADVLVTHEAALGRSLVRLDRTSSLLAQERDAVARTMRRLPAALAATEDGAGALRGTLRRLGRTTDELAPTARQLAPLFTELRPLLREALPMARRLTPLLRNARPLVRDLVPISRRAETIVGHLGGPVIDRVNGPILTMLGSTYRGSGPFRDTGGGIQADNKFYEEIGYMVTNIDRASQVHDPEGALLNFQAGVSVGTLAPLNLDEALAVLAPEVLGR